MMTSQTVSYSNFLFCATPSSWCKTASHQLELLLLDHAHCEKKAASSALTMLYRYPDKPTLLHKMSRLAREELRHFEQVLAIMQRRGINYRHVSPSNYAASLHAMVATYEPERLIDTLIVGAIIEARSCERFASLMPYLDDELKAFYQQLVKSEARHYEDYLHLAKEYAQDDISKRIDEFLQLEATLISKKDILFRFHSGCPASDADEL